MNFSKLCIASLFLFAGQCNLAQADSEDGEEWEPRPTKHDSACLAEWNKSSARASCSGENFMSQTPIGTCNLDETCLGAKQNATVRNTKSFSLDKLSKLSNCNGTLKVGSC
jgi:hypothetical protein